MSHGYCFFQTDAHSGLKIFVKKDADLRLENWV